ncbi:hypothetical protein [Hoeflea sp. TYP-13]|uniref:hypothetical protein n=1 Tax=Hoeflea sp. TYP-13 TaxID=3230023 RepID=UPI0034C5FA28
MKSMVAGRFRAGYTSSGTTFSARQQVIMISLSSLRKSRLAVPCFCLQLLAAAGLFLAGGVLSHADEAGALHVHATVESSGSKTADTHSHLEGGDIMPDVFAGSVIHCGAEILALSGSSMFPPFNLPADRQFENENDLFPIDTGYDPPPPRVAS